MKTSQRKDTDIQVSPEYLRLMEMLQSETMGTLVLMLARSGITLQTFYLMNALREERLAMSQIAKKLGHSTAAATGTVDLLEKRGLVQRFHTKKDRRLVWVRLRKEARILLNEIGMAFSTGEKTTA